MSAMTVVMGVFSHERVFFWSMSEDFTAAGTALTVTVSPPSTLDSSSISSTSNFPQGSSSAAPISRQFSVWMLASITSPVCGSQSPCQMPSRSSSTIWRSSSSSSALSV